MESARLKRWRMEYLILVHGYRQDGRNIIDLDKTWYDAHEVTDKGWVYLSGQCRTKGPSNKGKHITIIHTGTKSQEYKRLA